MPSAQKYFNATRTKEGGVRLTMRRRTFQDTGASFLPGSTKWRDDDESGYGSYLGDDGIARRGPIGDQENGSDMVEQTVYVGSPPATGASYKLKKLDNGCVALILVSPPDELLGDTVTSAKGMIPTDLNEGPSRAAAMDRATKFVARSRNQPKQLRTLNAINKAHFKR